MLSGLWQGEISGETLLLLNTISDVSAAARPLKSGPEDDGRYGLVAPSPRGRTGGPAWPLPGITVQGGFCSSLVEKVEE